MLRHHLHTHLNTQTPCWCSRTMCLGAYLDRLRVELNVCRPHLRLVDNNRDTHGPATWTLQRVGQCKRRVSPAAAFAWNRGERTYLRSCLRGSWRRWRRLLCSSPLRQITGKTLGVEMFDSTICFLFLSPRFTTEMIFDPTVAAHATLVPAPPAPTSVPQGRV